MDTFRTSNMEITNSEKNDKKISQNETNNLNNRLKKYPGTKQVVLPHFWFLENVEITYNYFIV